MAGNVYRVHVSFPLDKAQAVIQGIFSEARRRSMQPVTAVVLDVGGNLIAAAREDGCAVLRFPVAQGKAYGALGNGVSSRTVGSRNEARPAFLAAVAAASDGRFVPVPGGVLVLDDEREVIGAAGVRGDASDADEAAAVHGITAAGLEAGIEPGADDI